MGWGKWVLFFFIKVFIVVGGIVEREAREVIVIFKVCRESWVLFSVYI